jgi:hypothetical protein
MIRRTKFSILLFAACLLAVSGCKKFLDVNQNVNDPLSVPISILLPNAEKVLGDALNVGSGISNGLAVYAHQMSTRENPDQYGITGTDFYLNQGWDLLYNNCIADLDVIISQGTTQDNMRYVGIAKVLKAYAFSQLVDIFGDVPFSEFNRFKEGITQPKFDDDAEIYPQLLAMLDEGIADLKNTTAANLLVPAGNDIIYSGSTTKWIKAANTIKLKLLTQTRKVTNVGPQITALLSNPAELINAKEESFMLPYGPLGATDDRSPAFGDYIATQRSNHVSPWFYEILKGYNKNIYTDIVDPRVPYYIYNQVRPATSVAGTEYRDGGFISIYFGSTGPDRNGNQQNTISLFGIYPTGGKYDDGTGGTANASSGTGAAPYRFLTYADRLYLEAELINVGLVTGNSEAVFKAAVTASFAQVDYVISSFIKPTQTVPALIGTEKVTKYIDDVAALFSGASNEKKLEYIITQKWLSSVGSSVDQYTDYRRTSYPVLFDPRNPAMAPGGFAQPPINGNPDLAVQKPVPVIRSVDFPLSLPWQTSELELNASAPQQKTPSTSKIFWIP